jgi:hypothetical protein
MSRSAEDCAHQHLLDSLGGAPGIGAISTPANGWIGASVDTSVGHSWYLRVSATRDNSGVDRTHVIHTSVVYRF